MTDTSLEELMFPKDKSATNKRMTFTHLMIDNDSTAYYIGTGSFLYMIFTKLLQVQEA